MNLYTSCFANKTMPKDYIKVRISRGNPRWKLPYEIAGKIPELMPTREMLGMEFKEYQKMYWNILEKSGINKIKNILKPFGNNIVLLCFENVFEDTWCHRRIFADWYEAKTGKKVPELIY